MKNDAVARSGALLPGPFIFRLIIIAALCAAVSACGGGGGGGEREERTATGDTDGDGMPNGWEALFGLDFNDPDDGADDLDGDGLTNAEEFMMDGDPTRADTDFDTLDDKYEADNGLALDVPNTFADDLDGDGIPDIGEYHLGSAPNDAGDTPPKTGLYLEGFEEEDPDAGDYDLPAGWFVPAGADNGWNRSDLSLMVDGNFNLRSGGIGDLEQAVVVLPVWLDDSTMELWRRLSADNGDGLDIYLDSDLIYSDRGLDGWRKIGPFDIPAGYHEIAFVYTKDASGFAYGNNIWIEALSITPNDLDSDGDGMPDVWENANELNGNDPDDADLDSDGDGLSNLEEFEGGSDPNDTDTDSDNMLDAWEVQNGLDPADPADANLDPDGDGVINYGEWALDSDPNDGDSLPSLMDGYFESFEADPSPRDLAPLWFVPASSDQTWRRDGVANAWDGNFSIRPNGIRDLERASVVLPVFVPDSILRFGRRLSNDLGDGLEVYVDGARVFKATGLQGWADVDIALIEGFHEIRFDFVKDAAGKQYTNTIWLDKVSIFASNVDSDDDGMVDSWELSVGLNPGDPADADIDSDGDGLINREEFGQRTDPFADDSDGDGLSDGAEIDTYGTLPTEQDSDGDGISDGDEVDNGFDPLDGTDTLLDADGDGLGAYGEVIAGTDPQNADTDGDGMPDGWEVAGETDPLDVADSSADIDADGYTNYQEYRLATRPNDASSFPAALGAYSQSFEIPGLPFGWYGAIGVNLPWSVACSQASDGNCSLRAGQSSASVVNFMARFPEGTFEFDWLADTGSPFRVYVDDVEVFSYAGEPSETWATESLSLTEGVHEVRFEHAVGSDGGNVYIDNVRFATTELGLFDRPSNTACVAPPTSRNNVSVEFEYPYPEAVFDFPTGAFMAPGDETRWYVLEQAGLLKIFDVDDPANVRVWLDFTDNIRTDGEMGLLGMAFDPNFPTVPEVYVTYVSQTPDSDLRLVRIILDDVDNPVSVEEQLILEVDQDTAFHQGGDIEFGPDGYLYFGVGDDNEDDFGAQTTTSCTARCCESMCWACRGRVPAT